MSNRSFSQIVIFTMFFALGATAQKAPPPADSSQAIADRIIASETPVLVDFWAAWCGPCRMLTPVIHELEKEYNGKVLFIKVNVDVHKALSSYFGVSSIPAIFIIHKKNVVNTLTGVQPKKRYIEALKTILADAAKQKQIASPVKDTTVE